MCRPMAGQKDIQETILVFNSGLGGLTVYREIAAARPDADFLYVADDAAFPYGAIEEPALIARVVDLIGELIATPSARPRRHRLQHRLDHCAARSAQEFFVALRRHRAGDQAGLRKLSHAGAFPCSAPRPRSRANIPAR